MKASDAAYEVLAKAGKPLHVKDLTATMVADGLWTTEGKTPWDTLSAILGTEINQLGVASRFARRGANTFDLRRPDDPIPTIYEMGEGPKAWMFQGNPSRYDLLGGIAAGSLSNYAMNQHREHAVYGDRIFFFLSGAKAGVYAIGRVTSTAYKAAQANEFGEWKVDVAFEATIDPPLLRVPEITSDPVLATFDPFLGRMGTNFVMPANVARRLEELLVERHHPVDLAKSAKFDPVGYELDQSIEQARQAVKADLLEYLRNLSPPQFEKVIKLLLGELGYYDVDWVGGAGDHGVDVKGVLRYRGIADVPTYAQAKRFRAGNNVEPSAIGRLRGALPVEAHGIVLTTSDFTKQARSEAKMPGLKPIALVSGAELIDLMVDLGMGIEKRQVEIIRLAPAKLAADLEG